MIDDSPADTAWQNVIFKLIRIFCRFPRPTWLLHKKPFSFGSYYFCWKLVLLSPSILVYRWVQRDAAVLLSTSLSARRTREEKITNSDVLLFWLITPKVCNDSGNMRHNHHSIDKLLLSQIDYHPSTQSFPPAATDFLESRTLLGGTVVIWIFLFAWYCSTPRTYDQRNSNEQVLKFFFNPSYFQEKRGETQRKSSFNWDEKQAAKHSLWLDLTSKGFVYFPISLVFGLPLAYWQQKSCLIQTIDK